MAASSTPAAVPRPAAPRSVSFLDILQRCRKHPSWLALELLWRWGYGIPLLAVIAWQFQRIGAETATRVQATGVEHFSLQAPMAGAVAIAESYMILWPPVMRALAWLLPCAMAGWALAAGVGRNLMLRRYDRRLAWRPGPMVVLQLLRAAGLFAMVVAWFTAVRWAANFSLAGVSPASETTAEPSLVLYLALVIALSLAAITIWLLLSWVFSIAPLISLLEGCGVGASLKRSLRLGSLKKKLVEINLALGYLKLASTVLVMILTATPAAFVVAIQGFWLYLWWGVVSVLYMVLSDFFQVARVVGFVELWETYYPANHLAGPASVSRS
jgi:hypothetical protein